MRFRAVRGVRQLRSRCGGGGGPHVGYRIGGGDGILPCVRWAGVHDVAAGSARYCRAKVIKGLLLKSRQYRRWGRSSASAVKGGVWWGRHLDSR